MGSGGTVHIVVNNQIGFTTDPRFARSTPYATDIGKAYDCPVFHVNGDDAEAITFIHQLASDWRQQFKTDVIIDIICYRKQGHNETDQPSFTQPRMYDVIKKKKPALEIYIKQLLEEGTLTKEDVEEHKKWSHPRNHPFYSAIADF
jgi:2-oxoglutarate dehydrogenase E1 component